VASGSRGIYHYTSTIHVPLQDHRAPPCICYYKATEHHLPSEHAVEAGLHDRLARTTPVWREARTRAVWREGAKEHTSRDTPPAKSIHLETDLLQTAHFSRHLRSTLLETPQEHTSRDTSYKEHTC